MGGRYEPMPKDPNGSMRVAIQDQASKAFDLFFSQDVGSPTTLTTDGVKDAYSISVTTGHGFVAGDDLILVNTVTEHEYSGCIVSVAGDNTVNMDMPLNFGFLSASTVVQQVTHDLNVDGSGTRQTFSIGSPLTGRLDITRLLIQMTTTAVPEYIEFGDLTALTRGCVMRVVNGNINNLWNVKSNAELANLMFDFTIYDAEKSFNVNGIAGRMTYAGPEKHGVVLRINSGEAIELIVQDNLSGLLSFRIIACGHIVVD